jgi:uncharacterized protein (DUF983 family)
MSARMAATPPPTSHVSHDNDGDHATPPARPAAWLFIRRALRLRCPECGVSPMFVPARRVRSIWDWFTPLDGCPRCGYAYERESGYFLLATWAFNYGVVAGLGLIVALVIDHCFQPSLWKLVAIVAIPMPILSFLFARHAKALYVAMDHYFDPHRRTPPS